MKSTIIALALALLASTLPAHTPTPSPAVICQVRQHRGGPVCWCKTTGGRWAPYPMLACRVTQ